MRPPRRDSPGALHHVMNRGVGQRSIFETGRDMDHIQTRVGEVVEMGELEVFSFSFQPNHFHMVVGSPRGRLDVGMRLIEDDFARWFNFTRDRDGPLFRGRYRSKLIESTDYVDNLIWYVDRNAVESGLVRVPADYRYCSAWHFHRPPGPTWLSRRLVEEMWSRHRTGPFDPSRYGIEEIPPKSRLWRLLDRQLHSGSRPPPDLRNLLAATPAFVRDWLVERARNADGGRAGTLLLDPETVRTVLANMRGGKTAAPGRQLQPLEWWRMEAGLLYTVSGLSRREVAALLGTPGSSTGCRVTAHMEALIADEDYRAQAIEIVRAGVAIDYAPVLGGQWCQAPLAEVRPLVPGTTGRPTISGTGTG